MPWLRRLPGQLALSYARTTVAALLIFEVAAIVVLFVVVNSFLPQFVALGLQQEAVQMSTAFVHGTADRAAVDAWLAIPNSLASGEYDPGYLAVVDGEGLVVGSVGSERPAAGLDLLRAQPGPAGQLRRVLAGQTGPEGLASWQPDGSLIVMVPIRGPGGRVAGAMVQLTADARAANLFWVRLYSIVLAATAAVLVLFAAVAGTIFGLRTARGLTRRFQRLTVAVDGWSQGDFTRFIQDSSADEVGQLGRSLDRMASQLRDLLRARQELAVLEERNRLARELHDTVKQQVFAASMSVSGARARLQQDQPVEAMVTLVEAESLVRQAQQELAGLVRQLRPAALEGHTLDEALGAYVDAWSRQTGIDADTQVAPGLRLAPATEETLFRIAQEALSNVARHSGARTVRVRLSADEGAVALMVADDGSGLEGHDAGLGVGLDSMRERAEAAGGTFEVSGRPGAGTTVSVICPSGTGW